MAKEYKKPYAQIIRFKYEDIVVASNDADPFGGWGDDLFGDSSPMKSAAPAAPSDTGDAAKDFSDYLDNSSDLPK